MEYLLLLFFLFIGYLDWIFFFLKYLVKTSTHFSIGVSVLFFLFNSFSKFTWAALLTTD